MNTITNKPPKLRLYKTNVTINVPGLSLKLGAYPNAGLGQGISFNGLGAPLDLLGSSKRYNFNRLRSYPNGVFSQFHNPYGVGGAGYGPIVIKAENVEEKNVTINILGNGQRIEQVEDKPVEKKCDDTYKGCLYCESRKNLIEKTAENFDCNQFVNEVESCVTRPNLYQSKSIREGPPQLLNNIELARPNFIQSRSIREGRPQLLNNIELHKIAQNYIQQLDILDNDLQEVTLKRGQLLWSDEFDYSGIPNPDEWSQELGGNGWGNNELQYYSDTNAHVNDGNLMIVSKKENMANMPYTSARLVSKRKFKYGIIEYRAKLPKGLGTWPAFWLLAAKRPLQWPNDGEIDIMGHVGHELDIISTAFHTEKCNHMKGTQKGIKVKVDNLFDEFHTYSVDWNAKRLKFFIDDKETFSYYKEEDADEESWPFDNEMNIIINTAIGGQWAGALGIDDSIFPVIHVVDYVRHYESIDD